MENIYSMLFAVQFFIAVAIVLYRIYNGMNLGKLYDIKVSFMLFIGYLLCWLVGLMITLFNPETLILSQILKIENIMFMLNTLFFIIEIFFWLDVWANKTIVQARNSLKSVERSFKS